MPYQVNQKKYFLLMNEKSRGFQILQWRQMLRSMSITGKIVRRRRTFFNKTYSIESRGGQLV